MKNGKKAFLSFLAAALVASVVSAEEPVIGSVQTGFIVRDWDATFKKGAIASQAYSMLLSDAQEKYAGTVDVRDIVWAKGKRVDHQNREIVASGKIVSVSAEKSAHSMIQTSFVASSWDSLFNKKNIEAQAYIKLLEAGQKKHPGTVDVSDIVWKTSRTVDNQNTEIFATGKITRLAEVARAK
ncbi:MAG: hypothetical protein Ta2A_01860 [Treponemataceae bacterium]|nr:MAG: hypothetical protein Ta2A_01860 [Treponemataceae bacterium]